MDFARGPEGGPLIPTAMDQLRVCPPYGIYLLGGALQAQGHDVVIGDLVADGSIELDAYEEHLEDADLVGVGSTSLAWATAKRLVAKVKDLREDLPVVLGGVHGTRFPEHVLRTSQVDYVVRGEGEVALAALCATLEHGGALEDVPSLNWRDAAGAFHSTPEGERISKHAMASAPTPLYGQLPPGVYHAVSVESSRGCAFDCSFCSTSYRKSWRAIDPVPFVDRLEAVMPFADRGKSGSIQIVDDEFCLNPKRAIAIGKEIARRGLSQPLIYDARANDLLRRELLEVLAPYTHMLLIGAECGYEEGLKRIGKKVTLETLDGAAAALAEHGIADRALFSFILGLPWETQVEVEKTLAYAIRLHETYGVRLLLQWYVLIPGSNLWEVARQQQVVTAANYDHLGWLRDLYAFRAAVPLAPREVWEVSKLVWAAQKRTKKRLGQDPMHWVQYGVPYPIALSYPEELLPESRLAAAPFPASEGPRKAPRQVLPLARGG
jgi:radical SAM superfamily enzyme YgiQ (UPF0313 family)